MLEANFYDFPYNKIFWKSRKHLTVQYLIFRGGDTLYEASYAGIALQMPPLAVGFFQKEPLAAGGSEAIKCGRKK